jgi:predicted N-formylglutamate amidohydrolase
VEHHLAAIHGAFVEHLGGDVFRGEVDALAARLVEHRREQPHRELERLHIDARRTALAAFGIGLLAMSARGSARFKPPFILAAFARTQVDQNRTEGLAEVLRCSS